MLQRRGDTTRPTLLGRVRDWGDESAWAEFVEIYQPHLRRWCRGYGLGEADVDDAIQRIWIGLADRLRSFRYDPGRSFRGWLRRFCRSRVVDMLRETDPARAVALADLTAAGGLRAGAEPEPDDGDDPRRPRLLAIGDQVQRAVRDRVDAGTWRAFWLVEIEGRSVREAAEALGKSYAAAFAAHSRVRRHLRAEALRLGGPAGAGPA